MGTYYHESQVTDYPPYLAHYGVKGMKWGIRRYQDFRKGGVYRNISKYNTNQINGYYDANRRYKRSKKALKAKRRKRQITMDGYWFGKHKLKKLDVVPKQMLDVREEKSISLMFPEEEVLPVLCC